MTKNRPNFSSKIELVSRFPNFEKFIKNFQFLKIINFQNCPETCQSMTLDQFQPNPILTQKMAQNNDTIPIELPILPTHPF